MTTRARLLGVDYGTVRVGLAISDSAGKIASPLAQHVRRDTEQDARYIQQLVADEAVGRIIVGLPVHLDGREGQKAIEARAFGRWLADVTKLPVVFWDERFTTKEAESALWTAGLTHKKRKQRRDQVAATLLLQAYLDAGCPEEETPRALDD